MKRIFLVIVTNLSVLALLSVVNFIIERVFGVHLAGGGLGSLLVFTAVFGFGGSLISLALSQWRAKRMQGVRLIAAPQSDLVAVSTGLLRSMSRSQADAVLRHEIPHVANGDMVTLASLQGMLNTFVILLARTIGSFVDRALFMSHPRLDERIAALQSRIG